MNPTKVLRFFLGAFLPLVGQSSAVTKAQHLSFVNTFAHIPGPVFNFSAWQQPQINAFVYFFNQPHPCRKNETPVNQFTSSTGKHIEYGLTGVTGCDIWFLPTITYSYQIYHKRLYVQALPASGYHGVFAVASNRLRSWR